MSKEEFLTIASEWYDKNYHNTYSHYLSKGKTQSMKIPTRSLLLKEFFLNSTEWRNYNNFSKKIREYRNVIVHNFRIASITFINGASYVPKRMLFLNIKNGERFLRQPKNSELFQKDFIRRELQMNRDLQEIMSVLNELWEKPIHDLENLFFVKKTKCYYQNMG